jgi:hypothetical protein
MKKLIFVASMMAMASVASAAERPIVSWSRLALACGLDYAWYGAPAATSAKVPDFSKEWETGVYASYTLSAPPAGVKGPIVTLAASSCYGLDNKIVRTKVGIRVGLKPQE